MEAYHVPVLKNAPIKEALIDIRVKLPSTIEATSFDSFFKKIKNRYPEKQEQRVSQFSFELKPGESPVRASQFKVNGFRYVSSNKRKIVLAQLDGFTHSMLQPYTQWKDLRDETKRLWQIYKEIAKPEAITRIALRYINNLNIPLPISDFAEYLASPPVIPEGLPQAISGFLTRVILPEPSFGANAIITQAFEPAPPEEKITHLPVILDIDVFKYDSQGIDEKDAWDTIEQLRHFKNKIFDKSITDKLKETYK